MIKHVAGILLNLADIGLYNKKSKNDIIEYAKTYIDKMKIEGSLTNESSIQVSFFDKEQWGGLGFFGKELKEFNEFCNYLENKTSEAKIESKYLIIYFVPF